MFAFLISFLLGQATKKRVRQDLSLAQTLTAGVLEEVAKISNDESILIHIRGKDCVALEARYHKRCYQRYTKCLSNKPRDIGPTLYDQAFDEFCMEVIETRILQKKEILLLSFLLKKFIGCVQKIENTHICYQAARLKKRIQKKYPQIVFHGSKTMTRGTLVYADSIVAGNVADDMMDIDEVDNDSEEEDDDVTENSGPRPHQNNSCSLQQLFFAALEVRKLLGDCKGVGSTWPPDSHDLTLSSALDSVPAIIYNFLAWAVGYSQEPSLDKRVDITDDEQTKVLSIAQDLVYAESKGKRQTHKSLALGMAVRQTTGSIRLLKIIHGLGHCVSPSTVYKHDSALSIASSMEHDIIIPRNISKGTFATIVWDNNDFREETPTGRGTTHVANGIIIQEGNTTLKEKTEVSKTIRTVKALETNIAPYTCREKGSPSLQRNSSNISLEVENHSHVQDSARKIDLAYVLVKMTGAERGCYLPSWTGINTVINSEVRNVTKVGYLPVIDAPVTDLATVNALLQHSISISKRLDLQEIALVFDEAIYAKAQMIRWKVPEYQQRLVIRLGDFHASMSYCSAISKIYKDAGLQVCSCRGNIFPTFTKLFFFFQVPFL